MVRVPPAAAGSGPYCGQGGEPPSPDADVDQSQAAVPSSVPQALLLNANLTELDLSGRGLAALPEEAIAAMPSLKALDVSRNQLTTLHCLSGLKGLCRLDASHNSIPSLPDHFQSCLSLCHLDLSSNLLCTLPWWFSHLRRVGKLVLSYNRLDFRIDFGDLMKRWISLKHLEMKSCGVVHWPKWKACEGYSVVEVLHIGNDGDCLRTSLQNVIVEVPAEIANMTLLRELHMPGVGLGCISDWLLQLAHLEVLDLSRNCISMLPDAFCKAKELRWCSLRDNELIFLPEAMQGLTQLTWLDLSNNLISSMPKSMVDMDKLCYLDLHNNQLTLFQTEMVRMVGMKAFDMGGNKVDLTKCPDSVEPEDFERYKEMRDALRQSLGDCERIDVPPVESDESGDEREEDSESCSSEERSDQFSVDRGIESGPAAEPEAAWDSEDDFDPTLNERGKSESAVVCNTVGAEVACEEGQFSDAESDCS